jgi:hypothetical protein
MRNEDLDVRRNRMLGDAPEGVDTTNAANAEAEDRLDAPRLSRRVQILIAAALLIAVVVVVVGFVLMSPSPPQVHQSSASPAVTQLGPAPSPGAASAP